MKIGGSILFGAHLFLIHPILVWITWIKLYREIPEQRETICIFIYDWGYWGKLGIDGNEGKNYPEL